MTNEEKIELKLNANELLERESVEWLEVAKLECGVFACNGQFLAKKFNEINFRFCGEKEAQEVFKNNFAFILQHKYFNGSRSDEILHYIKDVVNDLSNMLENNIINITFETGDISSKKVDYLPCYCTAFKNGVYDFKNNRWFMLYQVTKVNDLYNIIINYDYSYIITSYINIDFNPIINIQEYEVEEIVKALKEITKEQHIYCFELLYNMAHNEYNKFDLNKFVHLIEILGYSVCYDFIQKFVILIGSGGNGKNSLFDGCLSSYLKPRPVNNNLDTIENDRFITGVLEGHAQNFFLESDPKTYKASTNLKNITGSPYQTIENKGENKHTGYINCKFIFSANDKDNIKFDDTTDGFKRRINMYEVFYHWDKNKDFLKNTDYYDTTFSEDLREFKDDISNVIMFVTLAQYGIKLATNNYTSAFNFTKNDYNAKYENVNFDLQESINDFTCERLSNYIVEHIRDDILKYSILDESRRALTSSVFKNAPTSLNDLRLKLKDNQWCLDFFSDNDFYITLAILKNILCYQGSTQMFTNELKKILKIHDFKNTYGNKRLAKIRCINGEKLTIVRE